MNAHSSAQKRPRVCVLIESYYPIIGGGETQSRITAEDLIAHDFDVMVITRQCNDTLKKYEEMGSIRIYRIPPKGSGHLMRWIMMFTALPALIKHRREFDVVLVPGYRVLGIPAVLISRWFNKIAILKADNNGEMSGEFFVGGLKKWNLELSSWPVRTILSWRNKIFQAADAYISISSDISKELVQGGISPSNIHTIPNSVDIEKFHPVSSQEKLSLRQKFDLPIDEKIIVYTGRLMSTKGLPLLIQVWKDLQPHYPDVKLLIVGGGSADIYNCEAYLHDYVAANHLEDSVYFTGNVSNVDEYLKASDIFVFPTEDEAFGISMIEAMACGLSVISTPVGGLKDIITPGENGLFAGVGDFEQLKQAIAELLEDPQKAGALGQAALSTVQSRYTRTAVAQKYVDYLTKAWQS